MTCAGNSTQIYSYAVYECDNYGVCHKTDKVFILDQAKMIAEYGSTSTTAIVMAFFKQMFPTITSGSGFGAILEGLSSGFDVITIRWRTPHWKLVRIK